ncbi:alpha-mannosidase [Sanguibacter gelidistatuariae]|uniref:Alpha-mannosidase n=1 Tax=Sanguibacter gelidistatuariae TaxID=1814289 RepID=A0A1G6HVW8_9MICO|nr:hypothetical protein [Sanguibacter gelidistatuariae]SDB97975.1 alpha-mannosidase [Sanguibacter gelidistatuariae]
MSTAPRDPAGPAAPEIVLVPHTHWDREWYEPFDVFRLRLAHVLGSILDTALADPDFRFTLDGQAAAAVDFLEMRPERRADLELLASEGRLAVGPWYILLDEFLCSGETIVRNLELGWRTAAELGTPMPVGYLPDMFGHTAQMPQILRRFGIEHAAGWRGVPAAVDKHAFRWQAPDGSTVRFENLFDGYASALDLFAVDGKLTGLAHEYRERTASWYDDEPVLGLVGSDHTSPRPDLMDLVRQHNAENPDFQFTVATLWEYLAGLPVPGPDLAVHTGELRSHARGNLLPGVFSIRTGIKEAMARAELMVTQAERLSALWSDEDHDTFLALAWRRIIESTAHDSVTGCGVDDTAEQVESRLAGARHVARAVRDRVLARLAQDVPADALLVANTLPAARTVQVEAEVALRHASDQVTATASDGTPLVVQPFEDLETVLGDETLASSDLIRLLARVHGRELFGQLVESYTWGEDTLEFIVAEVPETDAFDVSELRAEILQAMEQAGPWAVRTIARPRRRVLVEVPVPALGHTSVHLGHTPAGADPGRSQSSAGDVEVGRAANGWPQLTSPLVTVTVQPDGTLRVEGADGTVLDGVGRLVDEGDRGDSYNFGPCARGGVVDTAHPLAASDITVAHTGPIRAVLRYDRVLDVPAGLAEDHDERSPRTVPMTVTTEVELRAGEPFVRLATTVVNPVPDHRLRLHVPTAAVGSPATSWASSAFTVTERGRLGEAGWGEYPLPTFPAETFASAGSVSVLTDRVMEFELVDTDGSADLAFTLVRAVGLMSVNVHPLRDEPAGSQIPVPGAQYIGRSVTTRLAVLPSAGDPSWLAAGAPRQAETFRHPGLAVRGSAPLGGPLPADGTGPQIDSDVVVLTSLRPVPRDSGRGDGSRGGEIEARVVALTPDRAQVALSLGAGTRRTDLRGRGDEPVEGTVTITPWEIVTVRAPHASPVS